jgi:ribonuclease R
MELRLMELMKREDYIPLNTRQLAEQLNLGKSQIDELQTIIDECLQTGTIVRLKKNRYCLPKDADLITGMVRFRQNGAAVIYPIDSPGQAVFEPVWVHSEDTGVAMHEDHVVARINRERKRQRGKKGAFSNHGNEAETARIIRILRRARTTITGTLASTKFFYYMIPDDPRIVNDILVADPAQSELEQQPEVGDKVIVKMHEWTQRHVNPEGEIIKVLGKTHTPDAEFQSILHKYDLETTFPECAEFQTTKLPDSINGDDFPERKDFRNTFTLTIDPDDAKDFDDAISIQSLPNGDTRIGVHIADVSYYVKPDTPLDLEAKKRGNSTYLVGVVIPMLPEKLSNGLCSLVEGQDRLVKTVEFLVGKTGKIKSHKFFNSVIRSRKRLTYGQALGFLRGKTNEEMRAEPLPPSHQTGNTGSAISELTDEQIEEIRNALNKMWTIASKFRHNRLKRGSLELEMPEVKIYVDEEGYADRIIRSESDESHQLIEEFMLMANQQVAKALRDAGFALLYRVHDKPDPEKLAELSDYLSTVGISTGDLTQRKEVNRLLAKIKKHPQAHTLRVSFLRSLKAAEYRSSPDGHYGLSMDNYTHFTSPIRRYSDLVVHRVFDAYIHKRGFFKSDKNDTVAYSAAMTKQLAQHLSITEKRSTDAERETVKTKLMEYFERELEKNPKTHFSAFVSDVKNHGIFVELEETMAYGLVHVSTMTNDLYSLDDDGTKLIGRRTGKTFELGQKVMVMAERVDRFKRQIDFRLVDQDTPSKRGVKKGRPRSRKNR